MEYLPSEITLDILSRLPLESALRCQIVCKTWRTLLPQIITRVSLLLLYMEKSSGKLYYGEYDDNEIQNNVDDQQFSFTDKLTMLGHPLNKSGRRNGAMVGSCNGLVCFVLHLRYINDPIYISNPFTGEHVYLPSFVCKKGRMASGFGYHHSTKEYKVVRIFNPDDSSTGQVQVYTLGRDRTGWRNKGEVTYLFRGSQGVLANGALHWLDYKKFKIVAFDLAYEEFRILSSPPCFKHGIRASYQFLMLGGHYCVVHKQQLGNCMDIWFLKNVDTSHGADRSCWSWSREFSIPLEGLVNDSYEPFALTKNNKVLMWYNKTTLTRYDPKTSSSEKLFDVGMESERFQAIPHFMRTNVSLKALKRKF